MEKSKGGRDKENKSRGQKIYGPRSSSQHLVGDAFQHVGEQPNPSTAGQREEEENGEEEEIQQRRWEKTKGAINLPAQASHDTRPLSLWIITALSHATLQPQIPRQRKAKRTDVVEPTDRASPSTFLTLHCAKHWRRIWKREAREL